MAPGRISLAEQIAQLEEAAPVDYDPEDIQSRGADLDNDVNMDNAAVREHYIDVGPSKLRNRLPSVADPKYEGVRVSRKQLLEEVSEEEESFDEDEDDEDDMRHGGDGMSSGIEDMGGEYGMGSEDEEDGEREEPSESEESRQSGEEEEREEEEEEEEAPRPSQKRSQPHEESQPQVQPTGDATSTLKKTREEDLKKGKAVKRQIALWDSLLDTRIRLQKSVVSANRLPPPTEIKAYQDSPECSDAISKFLKEAMLFTNELAELQDDLLTVNEITTPPPRKRRRLDDDISLNEYPVVLQEATEDVATLEQAFHPYLIQTLSKWSSKIQAVAPSVLLPSNRGAFLKGGQTLKSVVQLIDENLADHDKLLERTQTLRVKKPRLGIKPAETKDEESEDKPGVENFDDTDFYQKLLRDIIDSRGDGNKNEDWMVLQKQKKAKKKVDTKASKGRKIRYDVHEKLQNFMVPVPTSVGAWHEEQVDELFASILGKGFENIAINAEEPKVQESIELTGFRVFG
ncbi:TRAUB-domain-containing protein [Agrocybe pediades]|nr:TRAUB-domain-containing protein [Agrocybe pediades]